MTQHELHDWEPRLAAIAAQAGGTDGAHDASHLRRVWSNARAIMDEHPQADRLVVMAACYLHDLVNLPKNHPERAQASRHAASEASAILAAQGFPPGRIEGVAHAIATHSFSAGLAPATLEARIVQDADRLDALGAVGLARLFYTAGRMGSALAHPDDPLGQTRAPDDRAYALDHIVVKLASLPAMMHTGAARRLGETRLAALESFRAAFAREWLGSSRCGDDACHAF